MDRIILRTENGELDFDSDCLEFTKHPWDAGHAHNKIDLKNAKEIAVSLGYSENAVEIVEMDSENDEYEEEEYHAPLRNYSGNCSTSYAFIP